ncbi:MAG: hypothetical protein MH137_03330 [Flavobacteriales bacterium]|nr:hypothetical protein [Flavobacteriales bacterium]
MNKNILRYTLLMALAMVIVSLARIMPHPYNFTPVAALALYGGARGKNTAFSFLLPLSVMIFSDLLVMQFLYPDLGSPMAYFGTQTMLSVYAAFAVIVVLGFLIRNKTKTSVIIGATLTSSALFYLITNFVSWAGNPFYPQTLSGLMACYAAGIPFYNNEITGSFFLNQFAGDLFFSALLFGAHALFTRRVSQTAHI